MDYESERELNELRYLIADLRVQTNMVTGSLNNLANVQRTNNSASAKNTNAQNNNANVTTRYQQIVDEETKKNDKFKENLTNAFDNSITMLASFGGALVSTEKGLQKYSQTIESLGKGASDLGQNFGLAGMASFGLVGLLTKLASSVLNLNQNTLDIRNNFVKAGGVLPTTTARLGELAKEAGFALDSMKILGDKMAELSESMSSLGGYAGQGALRFMEIAKVDDELRRQFGRLGVSQEELLNLQGMYLETQRVSGGYLVNQNKTTEEIQKESLQYAKTLLQLSSLTGESVEAIQKEVFAARLEIREQARQHRERTEIDRLRREGRHDEANELERQAKNRQDVITVLTAMYDRETAIQFASVMETGAISEETAPLALLIPGVQQLALNLKHSNNINEDLSNAVTRIDGAMRNQAGTLSTVLAHYPEYAEKFGLRLTSLSKVNNRSQETLTSIADILAGKMEDEEADPLANNIENVRKFERDAKKLLQTLLEFIDPMRNNNWVKVLTGALALAGAALTALAVVKIGGSALGWIFERGSSFMRPMYIKLSGGSLPSLGSAAFAGSAADPTGLGLRKADLVDKNGKPLGGAALDARLRKLSNERLPKTTSFALKQAAKNSAKILKGAATLAGSIALIGAGAATAIAAIGLALPTFAEGMKKFNEVDGENLKGVGIGLGGLGAGMLALAAEKIVGFFNLIGSALGAESPLQRATSTLKDFENIDVDPDKVERNGKATLAFAKAFEEMPSTTMSMSGMLAGFFSGPEIPYDEFEKFAAFEIDVAKAENNSKAFIAFSNALATYSGYGAIDGLGAVVTALADSAVQFFKVDPPEVRFKKFADLQIDPERAKENAIAFKDFSEGMRQYRGPPGGLSTISSLIGTQISRIFGPAGPIEAFIKFSKDSANIGPNAVMNARAFFNFARAIALLTGNTSTSSNETFITGDGTSGTGGVAMGPGQRTGNFFTGDAGTQQGNTVRIGNEIREGGTVSWRTNNPGNVSYGELARSYGAVGRWIRPNGDAQQRSTGIAIMPTLDHGYDLKMALWRRPLYANDTIAEGVSRWVTGTARPVASRTSNYASDLARAAGVNTSFPVRSLSDSQLRALVIKQQVHEGFREGTVRRAKVGGLFTGPTSGYPMELHGTELIVPVNSNSILMKLATEAETTANDAISNLTQVQKTNAAINGKTVRVPAIDIKRIESISSMFDRIIDVIDATDDIDKKILRYT